MLQLLILAFAMYVTLEIRVFTQDVVVTVHALVIVLVDVIVLALVPALALVNAINNHLLLVNKNI